MNQSSPPAYSPPDPSSHNPPYPTGTPYNQPVPYQPPVVSQPVYQEVHYHPPQENTIIVSNAPTAVGFLGPHSQVIVCPICHHTKSTRVGTEYSTKTHLFALVLCLFGCWLCCCLPYCMDSCQDKNHYCGHCGAFVGKHSG